MLAPAHAQLEWHVLALTQLEWHVLALTHAQLDWPALALAVSVSRPTSALTAINHLITIKMSNFTPKHAVDEMAKAAGHEVVHLPPYHCELNPI